MIHQLSFFCDHLMGQLNFFATYFQGHEGHREEHHGLSEKVGGLFLGGKKDHDDGEGHEVHHEEHHEGGGIKEKLEGKVEGLKEKKHRKKEKK